MPAIMMHSWRQSIKMKFTHIYEVISSAISLNLWATIFWQYKVQMGSASLTDVFFQPWSVREWQITNSTPAKIRGERRVKRRPLCSCSKMLRQCSLGGRDILFWNLTGLRPSNMVSAKSLIGCVTTNNCWDESSHRITALIVYKCRRYS